MLLAFVSAVSAANVPRNTGLVGVWLLTRAVAHGEEIDPSRLSKVTHTFDDQFFVIRVGEKEVLRARYSIDATASPKKIDVEYLNGPYSGTVLHGIYEVSADELKICIAHDGSAAPARFESPMGSKTTLDFYERDSGNQ
ncbi:MAG TPA: TIGR03067 domain-containing protein [Opitutaceae bacterium]|jgi:uncharacterized protein (TIGR03067 family)|nr:TIGR03067 domain-containing protein [Opitutaceae bacterium]